MGGCARSTDGAYVSRIYEYGKSGAGAQLITGFVIGEERREQRTEDEGLWCDRGTKRFIACLLPDQP